MYQGTRRFIYSHEALAKPLNGLLEFCYVYASSKNTHFTLAQFWSFRKQIDP